MELTIRDLVMFLNLGLFAFGLILWASPFFDFKQHYWRNSLLVTLGVGAFAMGICFFVKAFLFGLLPYQKTIESFLSKKL